MLVIESPYTDAYFNIASEEYLLNRFPTEDIFLLYVNAPSIIVGKFQNTLAEINLDYVEDNKIDVVRRLSGGGAVYHDLGNLNFSFHTLLGNNDFTEFATFTQPVINLLQRIGVSAKLEGRNDLLVDGKKFSGNAKTVKKGKMLQHGTILLNSDMSVLADALKVNPLKFTHKAVKSNRGRVTNLIDHFPADFQLGQFKSMLIDEILHASTDSKQYQFTAEDVEEIRRLALEKYSTWEWNFGFSPDYNFNKAIKIPAGFIEIHLDVHKGTIEQAKIYGDFFSSRPIEELEAVLIGKKHDPQAIGQVLMNVDLPIFFGKVTTEELLPLFY
ncbi:lipoate--protein ligase [Sphingobacterium bambusae]|uniref:lipoate--protein ligase n=1 Tax=Sphingobacterium bambusae TaxID=662858 RepID=A0ABW6BCR4_9SPHI|nr:lipoate--protein ligase [Sphingobacterium bambusae]WPL48229.1 lipoate--protein ligase [Sphingobacterium bambusae]